MYSPSTTQQHHQQQQQPPPVYDYHHPYHPHSSVAQQQHRHLPSPPPSIHEQHQQPKVFAFVSLPGINQKKRPRRKYHEIERLYHCNFPGCSKSYGTLNHLNAHVSMQQHGPKRHPSEFKELRKEWRQKRREQAKTNSTDGIANEQQEQVPPHALRHSHAHHFPHPHLEQPHISSTSYF
ncbi:hypothetical protein BDA99DRAFT_432954 [Phascolomyces articulosus]|uniref:C2H2-type domain-containing protein n=1 Tax=Phascolomyces articulosus TaxID=60185 RepID=A0AAD5PHX5_9FUNG|nr:hypothetical protein BDA99DRAFT_432954 [Phascolomyces articulosus]